MIDSDIIERAINQNDFYFLLTGQKDYELVNSFADTPTDSNAVFFNIVEYYKKTKDEDVWKELINGLLKLCESSDYIWLVTYYISCYLRYEKETRYKPMKLEGLNIAFNSGLKEFQRSLSDNYSWMGHGIEGGLYSDILRMSQSLEKRFGYHLLSDTFS
ncbi:hypothetical protein GCM10027578_26990 [Spirosoma luteolum]